jgi:hypothetical protein
VNTYLRINDSIPIVSNPRSDPSGVLFITGLACGCDNLTIAMKKRRGIASPRDARLKIEQLPRGEAVTGASRTDTRHREPP